MTIHIKKGTFIALCVILALVIIGFACTLIFKNVSNPTAIEKIAIEATSELRKTMIDRSSFACTDDLQVEIYSGYSENGEEFTNHDEAGTGTFEFLLIPYSAKNKMGARVEDYALYFLQRTNGEYSYQYIGNSDDYYDLADNSNYDDYPDMLGQFYVCHGLGYMSGFSYPEIISISAEMVSDKVGCDLIR